MPVNRQRAALLIVAVAGMAALTACGSSAKAGTPTGGAAGSTVSTTGNQGAGNSVADGLGHPVKVCDLLPAATVAQITGEAITVATEDDTASYKIYSCDYTNAAGTEGLDVSVLALDAAAGFDGDLKANGSAAHQISGLGDKAFSGVTGLQALFGNVSITVSNLQWEDAATKLIQTLQPKL